MISIETVDQWHLQRWTKFTASEIYKLLTSPKGNEQWSSGAMTYIEERAMQMTTKIEERPEMEEVKSLLWGKVYEYPAYEAYIQATRNTSMSYLGSENPIFLEYEPLKEESGGTPDVAHITQSGTVEALCEIKCPKNPIEHFRRLKWKDQWNIKENYPLVYAQMQFLLMITNAQICHFVSFDDRQLIRSKKIKIIDVKPDQKFQDNLEVKLRMAIKKKYEILSDHIGEQVKNRNEFMKLIK